MTVIEHLDLATDPAAQRVVKDETVIVAFATSMGELMSLEGPNRYAPGDALITGTTGERWVVSRERFDAKYVPIISATHGMAGAYRNRPVTVLAKQMPLAFSMPAAVRMERPVEPADNRCNGFQPSSTTLRIDCDVALPVLML